MTYGTSYFVSRTAAARYYRDFYDDIEAAITRKLAEGEIHIGEPPLKPGEVLLIVDDGTRYAIQEVKRGS